MKKQTSVGIKGGVDMSKLTNVNKKIENTVVTKYKKIENAVVSKYQKIEDKFIDTFLAEDGETTSQSKDRIKENIKNI